MRAGASLKSTDELLNDLVSGKRTLKVVQVSADQAKEIEAARIQADEMKDGIKIGMELVEKTAQQSIEDQ
jgi:hypothetical protein